MVSTRCPALVLLSTLLALGAAPGSASAQLPVAPAQSELVEEESGEIEAGRAEALSASDSDDPAARVMGEIGASAATIVGVGLVGGLVGAMVAPRCPPPDPEFGSFCLSPIVEILVGMMAGGIVGITLAPFSVAAAGDAITGRGDLEGAWLGWLVGLGSGALTAAIGLVAFTTLDRQTGSNILMISTSLAGVMVLVGPWIGYEISHGRARRSAATSVAPTFGFDGRSGTVGATGTF